MFSLRGKRGSGRVDGEGVERFWSLVVGAAFSGERKTTAHFLESIRDVFLSANAKLLSGIPNMLSRAAQRAFQALLQKIDELISLLIELDLHGFQLNDDVIEDWNSSLSGADVNASHVITPQAAYFGILEELETKKKLKATLEMTRLYSGQSEALSLKKITRSIKQLEKSAKDLCRQVGSGYQPTLEDKADFRKAAIAKLNVEIMQKEADLCLAKMSVQRGSNSLKHLHPSEKARNREAIENMKFVLGELKTKLSLHLSRSEPKTSSMNDSRTGLPTLVKMKVVGCYNAAKRCAEALGYLIPQELKCFIDTCSKRAAGLRGAASVIQAPSRLEFSEAALFYQRANYFDSLAAHGRAVQNVLVGIPSLASTAVHLFPWIELSLRKAATPPVPFESDEVLTSPVSEEVSCALLNCGCDAAQGLVLCKLVTQPVPRGQSTLKGSLPISSNTTSAFSTATIEVRDVSFTPCVQNIILVVNVMHVKPY